MSRYVRPLAPKLLYEFTVRLKAGARRLDRQFVQNFFQVGVHGGEPGSGLLRIISAPPDVFLTDT